MNKISWQGGALILSKREFCFPVGFELSYRLQVFMVYLQWTGIFSWRQHFLTTIKKQCQIAAVTSTSLLHDWPRIPISEWWLTLCHKPHPEFSGSFVSPSFAESSSSTLEVFPAYGQWKSHKREWPFHRNTDPCWNHSWVCLTFWLVSLFSATLGSITSRDLICSTLSYAGDKINHSSGIMTIDPKLISKKDACLHFMGCALGWRYEWHSITTP